MTHKSFLGCAIYDTVLNFYKNFFFGCKPKIRFIRMCLKVIIRKPIKALNALISISFKTVSKLAPLKKGVVS